MIRTIKYISIGIILIISLIIILGGGLGDRYDYELINQGKPIIFAHRGYVNLNVENSKESFSKSDSIGFNAIETDISCTKDGKLIIFHDKSAKRLLGIDTNINEMKWNDIKQRKLVYNGKQTKNKVLSLDEFLEQTNFSKILYLDIKETSKSIADSLLFILKKNRKKENIIIADENLLFLIYIKMKAPNIKVALEGFNKGKEWIYYIIPVNYKPDYYSSFLSEVNEKHIAFLKKHNLIKNKITYGVDANNINTVLSLGIQNIILDYDNSIGSIDNLEKKLLLKNQAKNKKNDTK